MTPNLFTPYRVGPVSLKNRIVMAPMCQYSAIDGMVQPWHLVHYPSRAYGGAAMVLLEASAVEARGRISPHDLGIWSDAHLPGLSELAGGIEAAGAVPGIQLAHSGRKGSTSRPFDGFGPIGPENGGWEVLAPSPLKYAEDYPRPREMSFEDVKEVQEAFILAARRAISAGFRVLEIHAAHGYLIHSFLSPLSNNRTDEYGGSFENRCRFLLEIGKEIRSLSESRAALLVRISADDWIEGGWTLDDSRQLASALKEIGVDMLHVSSGGILPQGRTSTQDRHFQVDLSGKIRSSGSLPTVAVGLITDPSQAESIIAGGQADLVALGRALLRNPYWPQLAAHELHAEEAPVPLQYVRAWRTASA